MTMGPGQPRPCPQLPLRQANLLIIQIPILQNTTARTGLNPKLKRNIAAELREPGTCLNEKGAKH
jgi:hypothetical protein